MRIQIRIQQLKLIRIHSDPDKDLDPQPCPRVKKAPDTGFRSTTLTLITFFSNDWQMISAVKSSSKAFYIYKLCQLIFSKWTFLSCFLLSLKVVYNELLFGKSAVPVPNE
jgi:hypothetical protein